MTIVEDSVMLPNEKNISYIRESPTKNHSVAIIALNTNGQLLLQKEYSYPPDEVMYQLPGGSIETDEDVLTAANRELSEESGYKSEKMRLVGSYYMNNRRSDRKQFVVLCKDLVPNKETEDAEEFIESEWIEIGNIKQLIRDGNMKNVNLLAALSLFDNTAVNT